MHDKISLKEKIYNFNLYFVATHRVIKEKSIDTSLKIIQNTIHQVIQKNPTMFQEEYLYRKIELMSRELIRLC